MRHAALLLTILIVGCSGCARHVTPPAPPPAPVALPLAPCNAPAAPVLPAVDGNSPLDSPANVRALLDRDSLVRRYITGLRAALDCYNEQTDDRSPR